MADKKLGISGSEVTLPATLVIPLPVKIRKQIEKQRMSDGSIRKGYFKTQRIWKLDFTSLTKANLDVLTLLYGYNQILRWQNNDESIVWYNVIIDDFSYDVIDPISTTKIYRATMILEESI